MSDPIPRFRLVWHLVAQVVDEIEAELDLLLADLDDRVLARIEATNGELSTELKEALGRAVQAGVRDALARLRSQAELPRELPPDLIELARLQAGSRCDPGEFADAWLVAQEVFWNHFSLMAELTLTDPARCWLVIRAARLQLSGHAARLSRLFRSAWEAENARAAETPRSS